MTGFKIVGFLRQCLFWIDSLGFHFLDDAYNFLIQVMAGFSETAIKTIINDIGKSAYVIVGIFALFKAAVSLINAIIDPEKISDKHKGIGNILIHVVGSIALFIAVPLIFDASRYVQKIIVTENYIPQLILGVDLTDYQLDENGDIIVNPDSSNNPGELFQLIIMKAAVTPNDLCDSGVCLQAKEVYENNQVRAITVSKFINEYEKIDAETYEWAYNYTPFILLVGGLFATYVIISFTIDIAIRNVELLVLEILSPLFIVTFVDPKMADSGAFKKWVQACIKTYVSLFIKIAIITLMLFFISELNKADGLFGNMGDFLKLFMFIAILIFAKKAPKWLGNILGIDMADSGLSMTKKLAGAALVGGLIQKGFDKTKGSVTKGAKRAGARTLNRTVSGTAGSLAARSAAKQNAMGDKSLRNIRNSALDATGSHAKANWAATKSFFNKEDAKARRDAIRELRKSGDLTAQGKKGKMDAILQGQISGLKGEFVSPGSLARGVKKTYDPNYKTHDEKILSGYESKVGKYSNAFDLSAIEKQKKLASDCNLASAITGQRCILADDGKGGKKIVYQSNGQEPVFDGKSLQKAYSTTTVSWGDMAAFNLSGGNINATIAGAGLKLKDGTPIEVGSVVAKNKDGDYEVYASKDQAKAKEEEIKNTYSSYGQKEMEAVFAERKLQNAQTYISAQDAISNIMQAMSKLELDMSPVTGKLNEIVKSNEEIDERLKTLNKKHDDSKDVAERVKLNEEIEQLRKQKENNKLQQDVLEQQKSSSDKYKKELEGRLYAFEQESARYYNPDNPISVKTSIKDSVTGQLKDITEVLNLANSTRIIEGLRKDVDKAKDAAKKANPGNLNKKDSN